MNPKPIEQARDPDLRHSAAALRRAALRAREVAQRTGTALVVMRDGKLEWLRPEPLPGAPLQAQQTIAEYGREE
ncbi:MAG: hypothetical protein ACK5TK_18130 [Betaproteobacteria bacterium]